MKDSFYEKNALRQIEPSQNQKANSQRNNSNITDFDRIAIPILNGHEIIKLKNIIRCEADGNYTVIFCVKNKKFVVSRHLKDLELILTAGGFLRIHHSHIINPQFIQKILKSEGGSVVLLDGKSVRISKGKHGILDHLFTEIKKL